MSVKHTHKIVLYLLCALSISLSGCSSDSQDKASTKPAGEPRYLTVKGSDTMVHLVSTWAEVYMDQNKDAEISVTGGGSGTGIAALINGTTDICAASRNIKPKEIQLAKKQGITPLETSVALDGIAVAVNPANPIKELTIEQIGKIFSGAITNWNQLGGPDQSILVLSRESSSGTYVFFQEKVLNKADYTQQARLMPGTAAVVQALVADTWSIGYIGLGYAMEAKDTIKVLGVRHSKEQPAVIPSFETVKNGQYPIARALYFYTNNQPAGLVNDFINFCLSSEGQKVVRETGYVQVN